MLLRCLRTVRILLKEYLRLGNAHLVPPPRKKSPSKKQHQKKLDNLSNKNACLEKELKDAYFKISKLEQELKVTKKIHLCDKKKNCKLETETFGEK